MTSPDANEAKYAWGETRLPEHDTATNLRQEYLKEILAGKRKPALEIIMDAWRGGYPIPGIYMFFRKRSRRSAQ